MIISSIKIVVSSSFLQFGTLRLQKMLKLMATKHQLFSLKLVRPMQQNQTR